MADCSLQYQPASITSSAFFSSFSADNLEILPGHHRAKQCVKFWCRLVNFDIHNYDSSFLSRKLYIFLMSQLKLSTPKVVAS